MTVTEDMVSVKDKLGKVCDDADKQWADSYIKQITAALNVVSQFREGDEFIRSFEKACLSAEATRKLKKEKGNEYQTHVLRCSTTLQEPLTTANDILAKIVNMGQAAHPDIWQTPKKAQKSSEKRKRSSTPSSA